MTILTLVLLALAFYAGKFRTCFPLSIYKCMEEFCAISYFIGAAQTQHSCSRFGTAFSQTRPTTHSSDDNTVVRIRGVVLNPITPAQCNQVATAWNYCFYVTGDDRDYTQVIHFAVYHNKSNKTVELYMQEPKSVTRVEVARNQYPPGFYCDTVQVNEAFDILEGDVIAVCLPLSDQHSRALDILASNTAQSNQLLVVPYHTHHCNPVDIEVLDSSEDVEWEYTNSGIAMHLYLETGKFLAKAIHIYSISVSDCYVIVIHIS